jgi:mono/diheme cytochrome c family protein
MASLPLGVLAVVAGTLGLYGVNQPPENSDKFLQLAQAADPDTVKLMADLMKEGRPLFVENCAPCHGKDGLGDVGPPLDGAVNVASRGFVVGQIIFGYPEHGMPPFDFLEDREIAAIATYIRNSWSNSFSLIDADRVARGRLAD